MATAIDWGTRVLTIPKADLTPVSGELYELDTEAWRLELKALETSEDGIVFPDIHRNPVDSGIVIAGVQYARFIEIINGFKVEFQVDGLVSPDDHYSVTLVGSNNNIFDEGVIVRNSVGVNSQNSAGLIKDTNADLAADVWAYQITPGFNVADLVRGIAAANLAKLSGAGGSTIIIRDVDDTKDAITASVDADGNRISLVLDLS